MNATILLLAASALSLAVHAQQPDSEPAQRARIKSERARVEAAFYAQEKACYGKFAVNDCLNEARALRREALSDLRRQEISLNDAERRRKAGERLRAIEENAKAAPKRAGPDTNKAPDGARDKPSVPSRAVTRKEPRAEKSGPIEPDHAISPEQAQQNRQRHEERLKRAEERRAELAKRQAERKKPRAQPLPVPP